MLRYFPFLLTVASSTPNLSLPLLCSGSVAPTADSHNVRRPSKLFINPWPFPSARPCRLETASPLFPTTHPSTHARDAQPRTGYQCNCIQLSPFPFAFEFELPRGLRFLSYFIENTRVAFRFSKFLRLVVDASFFIPWKITRVTFRFAEFFRLTVHAFFFISQNTMRASFRDFQNFPGSWSTLSFLLYGK